MLRVQCSHVRALWMCVRIYGDEPRRHECDIHAHLASRACLSNFSLTILLQAYLKNPFAKDNARPDRLAYTSVRVCLMSTCACIRVVHTCVRISVPLCVCARARAFSPRVKITYISILVMQSAKLTPGDTGTIAIQKPARCLVAV